MRSIWPQAGQGPQGPSEHWDLSQSRQKYLGGQCGCPVLVLVWAHAWDSSLGTWWQMLPASQVAEGQWAALHLWVAADETQKCEELLAKRRIKTLSTCLWQALGKDCIESRCCRGAAERQITRFTVAVQERMHSICNLTLPQCMTLADLQSWAVIAQQ